MSKKRTAQPQTASAITVAKPRTDAEEKLWQALRLHPGSTATALSAAAGIGKSTAPKILTCWEKEGVVVRNSGIADGGARTADRWSITVDEVPGDDVPGDDTSKESDSEEGSGKATRLAPGALRGLVEDYLRDNPGDLSPSAVGKALKRSAGAVHNALEKLVEAGVVKRTSDKPKRYAPAPE
ncbi:winged helix-turn-helix domain-containing protein [Lentzea sp. HUAS12]|uniref:winged helix-turn-helix domain-containing protein n=1 Tax=Lentzea sp. HUAS12 TaxID=2951806 RepID=UPI00209F4359|nr:winged helix-turn-helix domain-containing protein [Lentzea sp. HUAS12]USX56415.1 MarR family transcriptional regulator [Lentzea sp. HUAS12]